MIEITIKEMTVKKYTIPFFMLFILLAACGRSSPAVPTAPPTEAVTATFTPMPSATPTETPVPPTATPTATPTITLTPTPSYPAEGRGPTAFPADVSPLTGLEVTDTAVLNRRPIVIKVENIPRAHRPQWGLSLADLVYEYYTEFGATRFAAVYYGMDAEQVGPIRSGRFFDSNVVEMYKGVFVYGSAYPPVQSRFFNSTFAARLILETNRSCPALCRTDPNGQNLLVANTAEMAAYLTLRGVDNTPQNLDGMFFQMQPPSGGDDGEQVYVRYSGAIYNRWDYDPTTGKYLRFSDKQNDIERTNEVYEQLTDRLTGEPVAVENMVTICVPHSYFVRRDDAEVLDILLSPNAPSTVSCDGQTYTGGTGPAYIARDGKLYKVTWQRQGRDSVLTLLNEDGTPFPFKPGQTWFEVIGASSQVTQQDDGSWRFNHLIAP